MMNENSSEQIPHNGMLYLSKIYTHHFKKIFILIFLLILMLAWNHRWMADDAFISFRYAENFVHGNGLVWNNGEYVEGYTNFLWTILLSGFIAVGGNPAIWSEILGILFFAASLLYMYKLNTLIFQSKNIGFLLMILLGLNHTFNAFATGGLETQMQATFLLIIAYVCTQCILLKTWTVKRLLTLSFLSAAAILTRLDSSIVCTVMLTTMLGLFLRNKPAQGNIINFVLALAVPFMVIISTWFIWKLFYYGNILPNTYYAKVESPTSVKQGLYYIYAFHLRHFLILFPFIILIRIKALFTVANFYLVTLFLSITSWLSYVVYLGGDHIEFRFIVPVIPFIFILIGWVIFVIVPKKSVRIILILLVLAGTIYRELTYDEVIASSTGIAPLKQFDEEFTKEFGQWARAGRSLKEAFNGNKNVMIATTCAGAIPYYSQLPAVDMLGLTDPWIARHGKIIGTIPGHQLISPMSYLVNRKVNLLLGDPIIVRNHNEIKDIPLAPMDSTCQFSEAALIFIPINSEENLVALYLTESRVVDEAIKKYGWSVLWVRINQNPPNEF